MWWDKQELYDKERDKVEKVERERLKKQREEREKTPNEQLAETVEAKLKEDEVALELAEEMPPILRTRPRCLSGEKLREGRPYVGNKPPGRTLRPRTTVKRRWSRSRLVLNSRWKMRRIG